MQAQARNAEPEPFASAPDAVAAPAESSSGALVPIRRIETTTRPDTCRYPSATFLAHLIAVDRRMPQMRMRGRAAPQDAAAVYSAALRDPPARIGRKLRRSA